MITWQEGNILLNVQRNTPGSNEGHISGASQIILTYNLTPSTV